MVFDVTVTKLGRVESFEFEKLPPASMRYVIQYGLNKSINDAHASIKRTDFDSEAAWLAAVESAAYKRVEQIRSGEVPGTRAPADPNAARLRKFNKELETAGGAATDAELLAAIEFIKKARTKAGQRQSA